MAKIKPQDKTPVTPFAVKLRTDTQARITAYGTYLNPEDPSDDSYIVTAAFEELIRGDNEFSKYWEANKDRFQKPNVSRPVAKKSGRAATAKSASV